MQRRLAAILIADVVGYTRLSQADEMGARAHFKADLREVFEPKIAEHGGRLVKTMGDGLLVEFPSVVEALNCAVEIQRAKAERNAGMSADRRMDFRIAINLGDVMVEGDDIHGDGVNIADRLQRLAEPGGILISGTTYDQVRGKLDAEFDFRGEQRVKNVAEPVRIYRVLLASAPAGDATGKGPRTIKSLVRSWPRSALAAAAVVVAMAGAVLFWQWPREKPSEPASVEQMALPLPDQPSIAVLPFANMSDDPKQEYFADGMTDDLITGLSRVSNLFVISRNSSFSYKGKNTAPKQVSEELGVRYVLEGSVQRSGDRLRINAQLIDALSGGHVWADRFDGSLADVFALQDQVTRTVADALALRLNPGASTASRNETDVPAAYDALQRGMEHFRRTAIEDYAAARPLFERAIDLDPNYGRAYAALALLYLRIRDRDYGPALGIPQTLAWDKAKSYLEQAKRRPTSGSHLVAGYLLMDSTFSDDAIAEFQQAITLDPSDSWNYVFLGATLTNAGLPADGIAQIQTAMRLDPHYPSIFLYFLALAQFAQERYDQAAESLEEAIARNPNDQFSLLLLTAAYGYLGKIPEAQAAFARHNEIMVRRGYVPTSIWAVPRLYYRTVGAYNRLAQGLRLAGVSEYLLTGEFAAKNRLKAGDIRKLLFGHRLHGRDWNWRDWSAGAEYDALISADGRATLTGSWGSIVDTATSFDGDKFCYVATTGGKICGDMFRNPGGTRTLENEMIWSVRGQTFTFSPID
ncbi:MAG: adenylate/guanylate cyclase domain-containing protein [Dongiaceae bacterium]